MKDTVFGKYYARLKKEGILKAMLLGLLVGFSVLLCTAAICWYVGFNAVWVSAIVFAVVALGASFAFYFTLYRPTATAIAHRVDGLGLEERIITMHELEGDSSYIAMRQREDALAALRTADPKAIKVAVSLGVIIALAAVGFCAAGMTTVYSLEAAGVLPSGKELVAEMNKTEPMEYKLQYLVMGEGNIEGNVSQKVKESEDGAAVLAVSSDEWVFVGWSDGSRDPYRKDAAVKGNLTVTAVFESLEGEAQEEDINPYLTPQYVDPGQSGGGNPGDPNGNDPGDPGGGDGPGGGEFNANNQIINGDTFYGGSLFDQAHQGAQNQITGNQDMPDRLKDAIEGYYESIKK